MFQKQSQIIVSRSKLLLYQYSNTKLGIIVKSLCRSERRFENCFSFQIDINNDFERVFSFREFATKVNVLLHTKFKIIEASYNPRIREINLVH